MAETETTQLDVKVQQAQRLEGHDSEPAAVIDVTVRVRNKTNLITNLSAENLSFELHSDAGAKLSTLRIDSASNTQYLDADQQGSWEGRLHVVGTAVAAETPYQLRVHGLDATESVSFEFA